ncbi:MAG: SDR family oxidoreductase [Microcoleaceae cyanobacterium]|jgi:NAD(P)-dependent dehydrogenase (short-subunit alcohol dehydrogenase family)
MTHIAETVEDQNPDQYIQPTKKTNPQKRMIQPQEIGALAAFLCREEAFGITMQELTLSAGSL